MSAENDAETKPLEPPSPSEPPQTTAAPPTSAAMATSSPVAAMEPPKLQPLSTSGIINSSGPLGATNAARRPQPAATFSSRGGMNTPIEIQERLKNFRLSRSGAPPVPGRSVPGAAFQPPGPSTPGASTPGGMPMPMPMPMPSPGGMGIGGVPANFRLPNGGVLSPGPDMAHRSGAPKMSLAEKRGLKLTGNLPASPVPPASAPPGVGRKKPGLTLSQMQGGSATSGSGGPERKQETMLDKYSNFIDAKTGSLKFDGKAILDSQGVKFAGGTSFSISLDEVDTLDELGKGNYGTVYKVRHSRPRVRRPGLGLAGNKAHTSTTAGSTSQTRSISDEDKPAAGGADGTSGVVMAMKEIRLELDDAKFAAIIMELDILHRCASPYIIDFYGAFFQEGAVYICIEFMNGGSLDKIYGDGVPENILRKITLATVLGLKSLKEEHNIIHRDVKPTNILVNTRGQVKICDFGVSGNLVASIAKTNIGCQSYMAPERISSGGMASAGAAGGTYSVQSDIWSLGLTIIEAAMGRYPYPPETYNNIFSQLSAIVDGTPPDLPEGSFSEAARNFVAGCLNKIPKLRPTYAMLLQHAWLAPLLQPSPILEEDEDESPETATANGSSATEEQKTPVDEAPGGIVDKEVALWLRDALERKRLGKMKKSETPALHAAPLDVVASPEKEKVMSPVTDAAAAAVAGKEREIVAVTQLTETVEIVPQQT